MEAVKCEAFLAAAELGSLTATAELLGYTQSGVTRMIGTLEEELGFPLFLRSKKGVQLTENGKLMLPLLREVFKWGREANPSQPLSSPLWICPGVHGTRSNFPIVSFLGENCDIMTYHCYYGPEEMETFISFMQQFGRPVVCQEYMGRPRSTFEEIMPILKRERVGAISWGLTAGKCNFHLQWSSKAGDPEPEVWFHDIFRLDGTPYSQQEVDFIRSMTQDKTMN